MPRDWLLLFIAFRGAPGGLDPVRLQKGMFLLAHEGGLPEAETYDFVPYNYGPMSSAVYRDIDWLVANNLVLPVEVPGYSWHRFTATPTGIERARTFLEHAREVAPDAAQRLFEIKRVLSTQTFGQLLNDVYDRYPAFASRSVFRRPEHRS